MKLTDPGTSQMDGRGNTARYVHNFSSKILTHAQMALLQKDTGYSVGSASPVDFHATLEPRLHQLKVHDVVKHDIRVRIAGMLERARQTSNVTIEEQRALKQLNRDRTIIVLPADKERATVVLDRQDYVDKVETHLGDTTTYVLFDHNPWPSSVNGLCKVVDRLKRQGKLLPSDIRQIRPTDAAAARFYVLPKVHKQGIPLRPIVSLRGIPTFGLPKWMSTRLEGLIGESQTTVKSPVDFINQIRDLKLDTEVMVSFDIISLFTSIPQKLPINTGQRLLLKEDEWDEDNDPQWQTSWNCSASAWTRSSHSMEKSTSRSRAHPWDPRYRG